MTAGYAPCAGGRNGPSQSWQSLDSGDHPRGTVQVRSHSQIREVERPGIETPAWDLVKGEGKFGGNASCRP